MLMEIIIKAVGWLLSGFDWTQQRSGQRPPEQVFGSSRQDAAEWTDILDI